MKGDRFELRCPNKKFGEIMDGELEVKCSSKFCGAGPGIVVLHVYDITTGRMKETRKFRDPNRKE